MSHKIKAIPDKPYTYEEIEEIAHFLQQKVSLKPQIGIICGTGLGSITELMTDTTAFEYANIPKFPVSTVQGHLGRLLFGKLSAVPVVCMQGRFHLYEGYPLWLIAMPVRLMKLLGVTTLIVSNAAGGINRSFSVGDIMMIKDHINFIGFGGSNPLQGPNDDRWGLRFISMNDAHNMKMIKDAILIAKKMGLTGIQQGVYACVGGPNFETIAELKALQVLGADAVGMSTVHEVITAKHCGMKCFALSLITNKCVMEYESKDTPNHLEVLEVGKRRQKDFKILIEQLVPYLAKEP